MCLGFKCYAEKFGLHSIIMGESVQGFDQRNDMVHGFALRWSINQDGFMKKEALHAKRWGSLKEHYDICPDRENVRGPHAGQ